MIVDTDVLIWYLRGNKKAFQKIEELNKVYISVVTYMELIQGMRNKNELKIFYKQFTRWNAKIAYINEEISVKAMFYVERHFLSHSLEIADALIAATAIVNASKLLTCNDIHYKVIKELEIIKFRI